MKDFNNLQSEVYLTNLLRSYLEYNGLLFPTTAGALASVEDKIKKNPVVGSAVPFTAAEILRNGKMKPERTEGPQLPLKKEQFRAAAARNGKDIPDELRTKMLRDRKDAEDKKDGHESV
ncbi:MAG: hypothetical protein FD155_339 [Bacteroidetes bacterium]|nr:MAG: hypothetical protein FD155_339 [Bacteroidota bacterium]